MANAETKRVLVLGDAMVDAYLDTCPAGISDESPIMVLDYISMHRMLGGMLNVAYSLRSMGLSVHVVGLIGDDEAGVYLREEAELTGIAADWFTDGRPTTEKTRVGAGPDFLARLDWERTVPVDATLRGRVNQRLSHLVDQSDLVVVSDYAKGFMDETTARLLVDRCRSQDRMLLVDAKPSSFAWYRGATVFTPNHREAMMYAEQIDPGVSPRENHRSLTDEEAEQLGRILVRDLEGHVLLTRGEAGMSLIPANGTKATHLAAGAEVVVSTSGAGDVVLASIAAALIEGHALPDAARIASQAVARTVAREGTCRLEPDDQES